MDTSLIKPQDIVEDKEAWSAAIFEVTKSWTALSDWTRTYTVPGYVQLVIILFLLLQIGWFCFFYLSDFCS